MLAMALAQNDQPTVLKPPAPRPVSLQQAAIIAGCTAAGSVVLNAIVLLIVWNGEDIETPHPEINERLKADIESKKQAIADKTKAIADWEKKVDDAKNKAGATKDEIELQTMRSERAIQRLKDERRRLKDRGNTLQG
ncbi:hypothetical protein H4R18_003717, partial [Coemansia javaensis]